MMVRFEGQYLIKVINQYHFVFIYKRFCCNRHTDFNRKEIYSNETVENDACAQTEQMVMLLKSENLPIVALL